MKAVFTGYYGFDNFGDDLFTLACALGARRFWPEVDCSIAAPPTADLAATGVKLSPLVSANGDYGQGGWLGFACRLGTLVRALSANDLVVLGGGSVFTSGSLTALRRVQEAACALRLARFAALGISFGPFENTGHERRCVEFLKRFEYIATRDMASHRALESYRLPAKLAAGRDLAGLIPLLHEPAPAPSSRPVLGVAPCNFLKPGVGELHDELFAAVETFAAGRDLLVRCFVLNSHPRFGDDELADRLIGRLSARGVEVEGASLSEGTLHVWDRIASCHLMASVRLHGAVAAYLAGVPFLMVEYHDKCGEFVADVGQPEVLRVGRGDATRERILRALEEGLAAPPPSLSPQEYARQAAVNFTAAPWCGDRGGGWGRSGDAA
ncbi:polysaccharide pyruvyl transferase CsaB [Geomonas sp. Red276]